MQKATTNFDNHHKINLKTFLLWTLKFLYSIRPLH